MHGKYVRRGDHAERFGNGQSHCWLLRGQPGKQKSRNVHLRAHGLGAPVAEVTKRTVRCLTETHQVRSRCRGRDGCRGGRRACGLTITTGAGTCTSAGSSRISASTGWLRARDQLPQ